MSTFPSPLIPYRRILLAVALATALPGAPALALDLDLDPAVDAARRGDFEIRVLGADGEPLRRTLVEVELEDHEFLFGCNIYAFDRLGDPFRNQEYKRAFQRVFNYATLPFYWKSYEPERGSREDARTERILEWCKEHRVTAKGHPLVWTHPAGVPSWTEPLGGEELRPLVESRVRETVARFRGRMDLWDVVNEPVHTRPFGGFEDRVEQVVAVYRVAREADPAARLVLNEYHVLSEVTDFLPFARECLDAGAPIDAIGIQAHEPRAGHFTADRIRRVLDRHATLGKEIHLTEVTFPSKGQPVKRRGADGRWVETEERATEEWQARALEELYRGAFSHPAVAAITWWDLADNRSWLPGGGLLREDLSPKPAYRVLEKLVREEWRTRIRKRTDDDGRLAFRGFFGRYVVKAPESTAGGPARIELTRNGPRPGAVRLRTSWRIEPAGAEAVFGSGETPVFTVSGIGPPGAFTLLDAEGRSVRPLSPAKLSGGRWRFDLGELAPGSYRLRAGATPATLAAEEPFAVLPPARPSLPGPDGAIALDAALAWLGGERTRDVLELGRRAGVRWIRERLSWGEVEPQPGEWRWGRYDRVATDASEETISVVQVFHDAPSWARRNGGARSFPDDLRVVHRFAREAASHFRGRIQAWEPWNEPDIAVFSDEPADQYAAFLKAAYLGFKEGEPPALVLLGSLAMAPGAFAECVLENETAGYFDVYNYHSYEPLERFPARAAAHRMFRERHGIEAKPVWVTEAGIPLRTASGVLDAGQALEQARLLPRAIATSLAEDTARHFFFILPYYHENDVQFGLLGKKAGPTPGYVALATFTSMLGDAREARRLEGLPDGIDGVVSARGDGRDGAILWGEREGARLALPAGVSAFDHRGVPIRCESAGDDPAPPREIEPGDEVIYLLGEREAFEGWHPVARSGKPDRPSRAAENEVTLEAVVLRFVFPHDRASKRSESWRLSASGALSGALEVYNFSREDLSGELKLSASGGLEIERDAAGVVEVEAGGRASMPVKILSTPAARGEGRDTLRARAELHGRVGRREGRSSAAVIRVSLESGDAKAEG